MNKTWFTNFFGGVVVEAWRHAATPDQTRLEADFLERELHLRPGQRVLDVPCGLGRHSLDLARRGYRMVGVDVSTEMIQAAKTGAAEAGVQVEWVTAEMRDLAWQAEFDAAFCFGNSFGYLDRDGTRAFLAALSRSLKAGAHFAFDYGLAAECILPQFTGREWAQIGDLYFLESNRYHVAESCIETTYTFIRQGSTETRTGLHWVYTVGEIRSLLQEAGFADRSLYASHDGRPFELGSQILIVVAQKQ